MAGFSVIDVSGAFTDTLVFTLPVGLWRKTVLPMLDALYLDIDAPAIAIDLYFRDPTVLDEARLIPIIRGTVQHESRFCYPWWVEPATFTPWQLRLTKAAGAANSAFIKLQWSDNGGGL